MKTRTSHKNKKRIIIGLTGYKGSGKNAAADTLEGYRHISFAHPLRELCKVVFGLTDEEMADRELKEKPLSRWPYQSPRQILQTIGTDMFRKHYPGVWIEHFRRHAESFEGNLVATDVRFPDEGDTIREMGGFIIRIVRHGQILGENAHESEKAIDTLQVDGTVINDRTLEDLGHYLQQTIDDLL